MRLYINKPYKAQKQKQILSSKRIDVHNFWWRCRNLISIQFLPTVCVRINFFKKNIYKLPQQNFTPPPPKDLPALGLTESRQVSLHVPRRTWIAHMSQLRRRRGKECTGRPINYASAISKGKWILTECQDLNAKEGSDVNSSFSIFSGKAPFFLQCLSLPLFRLIHR